MLGIGGMLRLPDKNDRYAEGYRAGRIAALREVGCGYVRIGWEGRGVCKRDDPNAMCEACRLLAEAESGEDTGEVGDDR